CGGRSAPPSTADGRAMGVPETPARAEAADGAEAPPAPGPLGAGGAAAGEPALRLEVVRSATGHVAGQEDVLELVFCGGSWEGAAMLQGEDFVGFVVYGCYRGTMALRHMAVTPGHRGRGHGLALVEHVRGRCLEQGVEEIGLFASPEALGFYRALGFHEVVGEDGDADDDLQIPMARLAAGPLAPGRRLGEAPGLPLHGAGA
ncbi:unnamed protein product, partial [Prorocentrum cordatum]